MQEKGKYTKTTKPHILDGDFDLRSHMPCQGKVLTSTVLNILGKNGVWPSVAHKEKLWCFAARPRKQWRGNLRFLAGVTADMPHRPRRDILSPQTIYRISGTRRGRSLRLCPAHPVGGWRRIPCSHLWNRAIHSPQWAALPPSAALFVLVFMGIENVKTPKWHASNWAGEVLVSIPTAERTHTCIFLELYTNH